MPAASEFPRGAIGLIHINGTVNGTNVLLVPTCPGIAHVLDSINLKAYQFSAGALTALEIPMQVIGSTGGNYGIFASLILQQVPAASVVEADDTFTGPFEGIVGESLAFQFTFTAASTVVLGRFTWHDI